MIDDEAWEVRAGRVRAKQGCAFCTGKGSCKGKTCQISIAKPFCSRRVLIDPPGWKRFQASRFSCFMYRHAEVYACGLASLFRHLLVLGIRFLLGGAGGLAGHNFNTLCTEVQECARVVLHMGGAGLSSLPRPAGPATTPGWQAERDELAASQCQ